MDMNNDGSQPRSAQEISKADPPSAPAANQPDNLEAPPVFRRNEEDAHTSEDLASQVTAACDGAKGAATNRADAEVPANNASDGDRGNSADEVGETARLGTVDLPGEQWANRGEFATGIYQTAADGKVPENRGFLPVVGSAEENMPPPSTASPPTQVVGDTPGGIAAEQSGITSESAVTFQTSEESASQITGCCGNGEAAVPDQVDSAVRENWADEVGDGGSGFVGFGSAAPVQSHSLPPKGSEEETRQHPRPSI